MICAIILITYTCLISAAALFYMMKRYKVNGLRGLKNTIAKHRFMAVLAVLVLISLIASDVFTSMKYGLEKLPYFMRWITLLVGMYILANTDYREKKIPNIIILILLGIRVAFLIYEAISNLEYVRIAILYPLIGALIGGIIMLVAMLISRKGVGMGDVKMFFVVGAFVGSYEIIATMVYSFIFSAVTGIVLMISKKAKLKDYIPMAPFVFSGVALDYLLLIIGG